MKPARRAPTAAVFPLTLTDAPNWANRAGSAATILACWVHTVPLRVNT